MESDEDNEKSENTAIWKEREYWKPPASEGFKLDVGDAAGARGAGGSLPRAGPFPSHHRPLQPRPGTAPRGTGWNRGSAAAEPKPHRTPSIPARLRRPLHGQDNPVLLLLLPSHQPRLPPSLQLQRAARSPLVQSFSSGEYRGACV